MEITSTSKREKPASELKKRFSASKLSKAFNFKEHLKNESSDSDSAINSEDDKENEKEIRPVLGYFDFRGRAAPIRYMLRYIS